MFMGVTPQWTPKITKISQIPPTRAPATMGTVRASWLYATAMPFAAASERGPITKMVRGTMMTAQRKGVPMAFTTSGRRRSRNRSR